MTGIIPGVTIQEYTRTKELWVITTYFNPCKYVSRRTTFDRFAQTMRVSGINLLVVECVFGDQEYELPESLDVVRLRCNSLLWQKERLLNIAASWLPSSCTSIAWIDCDVVFDNPNWPVDTVRLLRTHKVVQLFETAVRLKKGDVIGHTADIVSSYGAIAPHNRKLISCGRYDSHGHTGYAWAARREVFSEIGLYEHAVTGSADHYMAHAIYGIYGFCVEHSLQNNPSGVIHLKEWGARFVEIVRGSFTAVPGKLTHLWHGDLAKRLYIDRVLRTNELGYNPFTDVISEPGKPMEWHPQMVKPHLQEYFAYYFAHRREDD